jgi:hypothetical protein
VTPPIEWFLWSAIILILSEYGAGARAAALARLTGGWRWTGTLIRLAAWLLFGVLTGLVRSPAGWLQIAEAAILIEFGALVLRRQIRRDVQRGAAHGRPWSHLIPLASAFVLGAAVQVSLGPAGSTPDHLLPPLVDRALIVAAALSLLWTWGTLATVSVIEVARPMQPSDESSPRPGGGEVIGLLERLLVFVLVLAGSLASVGFIVAFKSAARFPEFKDTAFAEYFLIGTLTSIGLATMLGLLVGALI